MRGQNSASNLLFGVRRPKKQRLSEAVIQELSQKAYDQLLDVDFNKSHDAFSDIKALSNDFYALELVAENLARLHARNNVLNHPQADQVLKLSFAKRNAKALEFVLQDKINLDLFTASQAEAVSTVFSKPETRDLFLEFSVPGDAFQASVHAFSLEAFKTSGYLVNYVVAEALSKKLIEDEIDEPIRLLLSDTKANHLWDHKNGLGEIHEQETLQDFGIVSFGNLLSRQSHERGASSWEDVKNVVVKNSLSWFLKTHARKLASSADSSVFDALRGESEPIGFTEQEINDMMSKYDFNGFGEQRMQGVRDHAMSIVLARFENV